uniref:Prostaglandin-H2 D-isomerase n=1 Tax=Corvus moneduloides TaxID=1196302 RepID=A0A8U7N4U8_CORMO
MQATLLGILGLALLGTLHAQDSIPVQADFQQDKFTGRWYSIGLASNSHWFKEKRHLMKMCTTIISATADGNLEVTSTYPKGDQCVTRNSLYIKTEQPGRFSYTSLRWGSKHNIHVVETNYDEYALVATQISKGTGSSTMVLLYSRTKELSPERLEMFTQFSREQGLTDDEILILPQTGEAGSTGRVSGSRGQDTPGGLRGRRPSWLVPASLWGQRGASHGVPPFRIPQGG